MMRFDPLAREPRPASRVSWGRTLGAAAFAAAAVVVLAAVPGCQTNAGAKYIAKDGAPTLQTRGGGCKVYTHLAGAPLDLPQPHKVVGEVESKRTKEQMREGGEGAIRELEVAACEAGIYAIIDIKVYPGSAMEGGATYIGKAAVFVDEEGNVLGDSPSEVDAGAPAVPEQKAAMSDGGV